MQPELEVLTISDRVSETLYAAEARERFAGVDVILSCGDLPHDYVEFVQDALRAPLFFVYGNHTQRMIGGGPNDRPLPQSGIDLHRRVEEYNGWLLAGFEGCLRYRPGPHQYSQAEMWLMVFELLPRLWLNRLTHGRYLDILVTHAPPWGVNDGADRAHQGFKALRWLVQTFQPRYHFHGHMHILGSSQSVATRFAQTWVVTTYGYRRSRINPAGDLGGGRP